MVKKSERFGIKYCWKALDNHEIDINDLATSLVSFSSLISQANNILNNGATKVDIKVKAHKPWSFGVDIELYQSIFWIIWVVWWNIDTIYDILVSLWLIWKDGLIEIIKKINGRPIKDIEVHDSTNTIILWDESKIENITQNTYLLYGDETIRKNINRLKDPLDKEWVDSFNTYYHDKEEEKIDKENKDLFEFAWWNYKEEVSKDRVSLKIIGAFFEENRKWEFRLMNNKIYCSIEDAIFLEKINKGECSFWKWDIIDVLLETKTLNNKSTYKVIEVYDYKPWAKQMRLQ